MGFRKVINLLQIKEKCNINVIIRKRLVRVYIFQACEKQKNYCVKIEKVVL